MVMHCDGRLMRISSAKRVQDQAMPSCEDDQIDTGVADREIGASERLEHLPLTLEDRVSRSVDDERVKMRVRDRLLMTVTSVGRLFHLADQPRELLEVGLLQSRDRFRCGQRL
jgi:hypothetical protein